MTRKQKRTVESERRKEEGEWKENAFLMCGNTGIHESLAYDSFS